MKKICLLVAVLSALVGCTPKKSLEITVTNLSPNDRINEMVTIPWEVVSKKLNLQIQDTGAFLVCDQEEKEIPFQVIYNGEQTPRSVIFPATVIAGSQVIYQIRKGNPGIVANRTFGRAVPERKDDFAWENDRIAFRMYGPALAPENPSNGVDVWLKKTNELIVDKFYKDDLENDLSYHIDHGFGLDCYKVGHTLGGGGIAPFLNDTLWIGGPYSTAKILDSGALRTSFELTYDSVPLSGKLVTQKIIITLDAYSQFNKAVVSYDGAFESFEVAGGFWLHSEMGNVRSCPEAGTIAYAENASDSKVPAGRTYIGVIFPDGMKTAVQYNDHLIGLSDYKKGDRFTYYFGAGWSDWGFESDDAWFDYVGTYSTNLQQPLTVSYQ